MICMYFGGFFLIFYYGAFDFTVSNIVLKFTNVMFIPCVLFILVKGAWIPFRILDSVWDAFNYSLGRFLIVFGDVFVSRKCEVRILKSDFITVPEAIYVNSEG